MHYIDCPWCGLRDESEFSYGGPADLIRPTLADDVSDQEWADYLFTRDNPCGEHHERWVHTFGCGQWLRLVRDTLSHKILRVDVLRKKQNIFPNITDERGI
ncbi:MAG: sarcosine oxidase subunit delta [Emcibacter sp.]|nr:sarcosine oxidase subunit delta [Emcibacter sp.]